MKIRAKIVMVVLPLVITTLLLAGISAYFSATTGITRIAQDFLDFKATELRKYAQGQWSMLVENQFSERTEYVLAAQQGVEEYARSLVRTQTEVTAAFDQNGLLAMATTPLTILDDERRALDEVVTTRSADLQTLRLGGAERVAKGFFFEPFQWYILVTEERDTFYSEVNQITYQTGIILSAASLLAIAMLLVFARYLTTPLTRVVQTMREIIKSNDLSQRVAVEYRDETGQLAHTFNIMVGELEKAYGSIKKHAFSAVVAQKKEQRIRNIFQRYVPKNVIDTFFANPESMLVGDERLMVILFSDIRSFTTISESMKPDELVNTLNRYFDRMVDVLLDHNAIVDKYIGDAIMAFFGAPVQREEDAIESVMAGIEMTERLEVFNAEQRASGKPEWQMGVGINRGAVTVGNIGTERKMDYTVIGDPVNLASRLEGLTKEYHQPLLISETVQMKVKDLLPCRLIDSVAVKGKTMGVKIYAVKRQLSESEKKAWAIHEMAMDHYYKQEFSRARTFFTEVHEYLPDDYPSALMAKQCDDFITQPPPPNWDGVRIMKKK